MELRHPKEFLPVAAILSGLALLVFYFVAAAGLLREGTVSFRIAQTLRFVPKTESATTTPAIPMEPDRTRPFAVMIDNHPDALPQSGVARADVVWEALVEGGLTRIMAVYSSASASEIGPVRSARPYFMDWARGHDAVYVHSGGSDEALKKLADGSTGLDDANEFKQQKAFRRDAVRKAPHNLYTSSALIRTLIAERGWREETDLIDPSLRSDVLIGERPAASTITVRYGNGGGSSEFQYNEASGGYNKYLGTKRLEDRAGGVVTPKTVVIIDVEYQKVADPQGKGLIGLQTTGSGKAWVFRNGKAVEGTWKKAATADPLEVYDSENGKIPFAFGQLWITVIAGNKGGGVSWR
jgi:hypothetical protein